VYDGEFAKRLIAGMPCGYIVGLFDEVG